MYVGKSKKKYLEGSLNDFYTRIKKYVPLEEIIVKDVSGGKGITDVQRNETEGNTILEKLKKDDFLILLDEKGKRLTSRSFAKFLEDKMIYERKDVVFLVGGASGFSPAVYERANDQVRLSEMTFSHQLIRLIMAEQLYRAMTIINGHPYHND